MDIAALASCVLTECSYTWEDVKAGSDEVKDPINAHNRWIWCEAWDDWIVICSLAFHDQPFVTPHPALLRSVLRRSAAIRMTKTWWRLSLPSEMAGEKLSQHDQGKCLGRSSNV